MNLSNPEDDKWLQAAIVEAELLVNGPDGAGKHRDAVTQYSARYHLHKARGHADAYRAGIDQDQDSRLHTLAHVAVRAMFALACALKEDAAAEQRSVEQG